MEVITLVLFLVFIFRFIKEEVREEKEFSRRENEPVFRFDTETSELKDKKGNVLKSEQPQSQEPVKTFSYVGEDNDTAVEEADVIEPVEPKHNGKLVIKPESAETDVSTAAIDRLYESIDDYYASYESPTMARRDSTRPRFLEIRNAGLGRNRSNSKGDPMEAVDMVDEAYLEALTQNVSFVAEDEDTIQPVIEDYAVANRASTGSGKSSTYKEV